MPALLGVLGRGLYIPGAPRCVIELL